MLFPSLLLLGGALVSAQYANESLVPRGTPIPGNYTGGLRPQIHFSPPQGFMNDPNGLFVDANGTWHLYYQYNPTDIVAGNQHWGHATSKDLYTWHNQPIAIFPGAVGEGIFSGSAVIDANNTSGFFPGQDNGVVAIYTLNTPVSETQQIAYSRDGGYTFTKYDKNPVISINSTQFRDPKVIWHSETQRWVMVVSYAQDFVIGYYTSPNLKDWTHASNFSHHGLLGLQYECPNMVSMPLEGQDGYIWVLAISVNPGGPQGGSFTQYFPGSFNGTHFTPVDGAARLTDFGKDNYAGQWFFGIPDGQNQVSIAWASNWQYTNQAPTGSEGWRSVATVPRVNYLREIPRVGYTLVSRPYDFTPLYQSVIAENKSIVTNGTILADYSSLESNTVYFSINVTGVNVTAPSGNVNFTFTSSTTGESLRGGFSIGGDAWVDRGNLHGFDYPYFTDKFSTNSPVLSTGDWSLSGIVDRSILELFIDGGDRSATFSYFPVGVLDQAYINIETLNDNATASVAIWGLKSTWEN